jgi:hypothetical protein
MVNAFGIIFGILLVVAIVVFMDWWGWRKERESRDRAARRCLQEPRAAPGVYFDAPRTSAPFSIGGLP